MNTLYQLDLVPLAWLSTLRTAVERQDAADASLADGIPLLQIRRRLALGSQAYQFFPTTSFSM